MTELEIPNTTASRRGVLLGAGALGAGAVLAGCGGSTTAAPTSPAGDTVAATEKAAGTQVKVADVPVGGGLVLKDAKVVVTQPQAGQFHAFSAVCTHKQCIVGAVTADVIACPCHGSRFSAITGAVEKGPADEPLAVKKVTVAGAVLTVS